MLLLGRTSTGELDDGEEADDDNFTRCISFVKELETTWWRIWSHQVFDSLLPIKKWKEPSENLEVGDICQKGWESNLGKGRYRICKVIETFSDEAGLVRTVKIIMRPFNSREKGIPSKWYKEEEMETEKISIQRLILIHRNSKPIPVLNEALEPITEI